MQHAYNSYQHMSQNVLVSTVIFMMQGCEICLKECQKHFIPQCIALLTSMSESFTPTHINIDHI